MSARKCLLWVVLLGAMMWPLPGVWGQSEAGGEGSQRWAPDRPWEVIEVAIVLDTSETMEVLLDAARTKIWEIVADLALLDPAPTLRVALVTYGNKLNNPRAGWVRIETDLTTDLDEFSERLFALTTGGGQEYVARALKVAIEEISWTPSREALKIVFLAGNEAADQDPTVNMHEMSIRANREGLFIQAIYCGQVENQNNRGRLANIESWREIAISAQGEFASIDHRAAVVSVKSPFDEELVELGAALNKTFIPIGEEGVKRQENLISQDANAEKLGVGVAASRAQVKASRLYVSGWDLLDTMEAQGETVPDLEDAELPEQLKGMSPEEQASYLEDLSYKREEIRKQILELGAKRRGYVATELKTKAPDGGGTFDSVIRRALRERAQEKGFQVPEH